MGTNIGTRVNLTLPPEVVAEIDRISAASGKARARIIRSWLIEGMPIWKQVADALEIVQENEAEGLKMISSVLNVTGSTAQQMSLEIKNTRRRLKRKNATT